MAKKTEDGTVESQISVIKTILEPIPAKIDSILNLFNGFKEEQIKSHTELKGSNTAQDDKIKVLETQFSGIDQILNDPIEGVIAKVHNLDIYLTGVKNKKEQKSTLTKTSVINLAIGIINIFVGGLLLLLLSGALK